MGGMQIDTSGIRAAIAATGASAIVALTVCTAPAASAQPASGPPAPTALETSAAIAPSMSPDRLGAKAALTVTVRYSGGAFGVPSPVRNSILRLPAGLSLDIPSLRSCSATRLRARGPSGCPAQSVLGRGHALVEAHAGTEVITEEAAMWVFLGPPDNLQPTFEVLAQGYTPIDERKVFTGTALPATAPYGEELELAIPPIPTLMFVPDASIVTFSLTIGPDTHRRTREANAIVVPSSCPVGGFPFAAEFTYADGSTGSSLATAPCPR
jgi:hypothetical protein